MEIYKISLDKWDLSPIIRQTDRQTDSSRISLSFFPAYNQSFLTLFQGTCCVHGHSVGGARPFCALANPAFGERGCPQSV